MPQFVLRCIDGERGPELRPVTREAHLAYVRGSGVVRIAGPLLDEKGAPMGSLLIVEADNVAAARGFSDGDPYAIAGVFARVEITPINLSYINLPADTARG